MVFYFKARPEAGDYTIFMGLDKFENEELIKHGFPEDIWFHVDKMSSAHVYVRLHKGQTIDDISEGLLEDCAQLVKANSIQGNKVNNIDVVYTPWQNLKKTPSMDVGQVGFHNSKGVRTVRVEKRINEVVNRLNRTKVERTPDLKGSTSETPPNDSGEGQTTVAVSGELLSTGNTSASNEYAEATHANGNSSPNSSSNSSLSKALTSIISSVIRDFDSQAEETIRSQDQLSFAIDRLTRELDELLEDAPSPFIMQHAVKISSVRKRVSSLNAVLKSIQRRVDNIDRLLSAGLPSGTFLP